jgi:hypothetical protein
VFLAGEQLPIMHLRELRLPIVDTAEDDRYHVSPPPPSAGAPQ